MNSKDTNSEPTNAAIPVEEAAQWIVRIVASDGVVSPSERKIIREFAKKYGLNGAKLIRAARARTKKVAIPEVEGVSHSEMKGRMFEKFVASLMADKAAFRLLSWRSDKIVGNTYAAENLYPDLHAAQKLDATTEVQYFIECKYRSRWSDDGIDLSDRYPRYHAHAKEHNEELFIALGVGGSPSAPDEFYLIPARMIRKDCILSPVRHAKCRLLAPSANSFRDYIAHYYHSRVLKPRPTAARKKTAH